MNVTVNITPRQVGKTSKCIELLYDNPSAIMFVMDFKNVTRIGREHPNLQGRILTYDSTPLSLIGRSLSTIILDEYFFYGHKSKFYHNIIPQLTNDSNIIIYTTDNNTAIYDNDYVRELSRCNPEDNGWIDGQLTAIIDNLRYSFMLGSNVKVNKITSTDFISTKGYDYITQPYKFHSQPKELTMKQISELLGYDVKVVK